MYQFFVSLSALLLIAAAVDYVYISWRRLAAPVLATWILLWIMVFLACSMQWQVHGYESISRNIGLFASLATNTIIVVGLCTFHIQAQTLHVAFNPLQWSCLVAGLSITTLWFYTHDPLLSYTLLQCIGLLAYFVTAQRLWNAKRSSEPLRFWILCLAGNSCALYSAWQKRDIYSWIYLARVLPSLSFMLFLIWRAKRQTPTT